MGILDGIVEWIAEQVMNILDLITTWYHKSIGNQSKRFESYALFLYYE